MSYRWKEALGVISIGVCMALALACGGGGSSGGSSSSTSSTSTSGSTTVAAIVSYPATTSAKPGEEGYGNVEKTVLTGAVVTLTLPDGTQYQMSHSENGKYEVDVSGFDGSDGFVIEASQGDIELTKLIPAATLLGDTSSFDAGDVDDASTAFVEIVKQVASAIEDSIGISGVNLDLATNLMDSLDEIKAQVDLITLSNEVEAGTNATYQQVVTSVSGALAAGDPDSTSTTSVIDSLDFSSVSTAISTGTITYPATSTDLEAVRTVAANLHAGWLEQDAAKASATMAETLLWTGATKTETLSNWQLEWTEENASGGDTTFSGEILAEKVSDTEYWAGVRGITTQVDSSGNVVDWWYDDASKILSERIFIEDVSGAWLVIGNGHKYNCHVRYSQVLVYNDGNNSGTETSSTGIVMPFVEQNLTSTNTISSTTNPTVTGGIITGTLTLISDSDQDDSEQDWWPDGSVDMTDLAPSTSDFYTFNIEFESSTGISAEASTASLNMYEHIGDTGLKLNSFSVDSTTVSASWTPPTLDWKFTELNLMITAEGSSDEIYEKYTNPNLTTSLSVSATGLTSGQAYTLHISFYDIYDNEYKIAKNFVMP